MTNKIHARYAGSALDFYRYIGVKAALEELRVAVATAAGSSGGAIATVGDGSGLTAMDMTEAGMEMLPLWAKLVDPRWTPWSTWTKAGIAKGDALEAILRKYIAPTFADMQIPIAMWTANMTTMQPCEWSTRRTPFDNAPKATVGSCRLPGLFEPWIIGKGRRREKHRDGGLFYNYPIDFQFPDQDTAIPTIGFMFHTTLGAANPNAADENLVEDVISSLSPIMASASRQHVARAHWARSIILGTTTSGLNFAKTKEEVRSDIDTGRESVLRWWDLHGKTL